MIVLCLQVLLQVPQQVWGYTVKPNGFDLWCPKASTEFIPGGLVDIPRTFLACFWMSSL